MDEEKVIQILAIVICALVISIIIIGFVFYNKVPSKERSRLMQEGFDDGYRIAVSKVFSMASRCEIIPVNYYNMTLNVSGVDC